MFLKDNNQTAAYAVFIHGINYISVTFVGFIFFLKEREKIFFLFCFFTQLTMTSLSVVNIL